MREHIGLFRGKRIDNGEWVEGWLVIKKDPLLEITYCFILAYGKGESYVTWHPVYPTTIGECTALRDKNGKLIFEGDVLECKCGLSPSCKVIFNEFCSAFQLMTAEGFSDFFLCAFDHTHMEIIGNIHDNPELLKGGEGDG